MLPCRACASAFYPCFLGGGRKTRGLFFAVQSVKASASRVLRVLPQNGDLFTGERTHPNRVSAVCGPTPYYIDAGTSDFFLNLLVFVLYIAAGRKEQQCKGDAGPAPDRFSPPPLPPPPPWAPTNGQGSCGPLPTKAG